MQNIVFKHSTEKLRTPLTKAAWSAWVGRSCPDWPSPPVQRASHKCVQDRRSRRSTGVLQWAQLG